MSNLPWTFGNTVIAGGPNVGKTTLSDSYAGDNVKVRHTDDLISSHDFSASSAEVSEWFNESGDTWVIEGVAVPRALRKWLAANPTGKPCDTAIWMQDPKSEQSEGQQAMAKGCATVWAEIVDELQARGVVILDA